MNYQPKVIRCRLKTGGKTIQEIREKNKGQGMVYRDFENIKKTYDILDGVVLLLSLWDYDKHASYHLHNWDAADDERMMTAFYYAEQYHPFRDMRPYLKSLRPIGRRKPMTPEVRSPLTRRTWKRSKRFAKRFCRRTRPRPSEAETEEAQAAAKIERSV